MDALNWFGSVFHLHYVMICNGHVSFLSFFFSKGWKKQKTLSGVASSCHTRYARIVGLVEVYSLVTLYPDLVWSLPERPRVLLQSVFFDKKRDSLFSANQETNQLNTLLRRASREWGGARAPSKI